MSIRYLIINKCKYNMFICNVCWRSHFYNELVPDLNMYCKHTYVLDRENTCKHMHLSLCLTLLRFQSILDLTEQKSIIG